MIQVDSYYFTSRLKFLKALIVRFAIARPFVLFAIIRPFVFIRFTLTMRDKFIQQVLTMPKAAEEFRKWRGIGLTTVTKALLYMIKIKRFYGVHEPNENFWKYGVSITSEMVFTESLLLQKALSFQQKRAFIQKILFSFFKWGTLAQRKGHFFHF